MSRLFLIVVLLAALVAAASLVASVFERRPETGTTLPATRRSGAIQKISYALLITVMCGVATGWLGAE